MTYSHITHEERIQVAILLRSGKNKREIAEILGKHPSTIGREVEKNRGDTATGYDLIEAEKNVHRRRTMANQRFRKLGNDKKLTRYVLEKLKKYWSPEQIAGRLKLKHGKSLICPETIYQYIYEQDPKLKKYLRIQKGKYRRRHGTKIREREREELRKTRIDQRPLIIEQRKRIGDWEGDTVLGGEKIKRILTHVERKSGVLLAHKLDSSTAIHVRVMTNIAFQDIPKRKRKSITYDNGTEFSEFEMLERDLKTPIYFAYPYHSWERGTNENTNGLLRQFFPKKTLFGPITQKKLDSVTRLINTRPRKRHNYHTPLEIFSEKIALRTGI